MNSLLRSLAGYFGLKSFGFRKQNPITKASIILEQKYGHYESSRKRISVNEAGQPIPWFTYPCIEFIDQLDLSAKVMLEWGSGSSSEYFAGKVKKIFSVEHNQQWFEQIKSKGIQNHHIVCLPADVYSIVPKDYPALFDIILIDGIEREGCANSAIRVLNAGGILILDNSDRHPDICARLRQENLIQVDFHGFGPINPYTWTTSIFLMRDVDLQPVTIQPRIPIGGGF